MGNNFLINMMTKTAKINIFVILSALLFILSFPAFTASQPIPKKWQQTYSELNKNYTLARNLIQKKKYKKAKSIYKKILSIKYDNNSRVFNNQNSKLIQPLHI